MQNRILYPANHLLHYYQKGEIKNMTIKTAEKSTNRILSKKEKEKV